MPEPGDRPTIDLDSLCHEAVRACGVDWHEIEHYVTDRLCRMPREERDAVLGGVSKILRYDPPRR